MKTTTLLLALAMAASSSYAHTIPSVTLDGKLNCPYISSRGGTAYLQITLTTGEMRRPERDRKPLNLAVVLDRSGSMGDERKMEYAKAALLKLIDRLRPGDVFSLVVYDDVIDVLRPAQRVGESKSRLRRLVSDIYPRNSTNLGGGMIEGFRQVERNQSREFINRVILLSDGLANQGITSPHELNRIARRHRSHAISLTTMGVGLDYNENLMVGLSESGGGNYYFIESPGQLASILHRELESASAVFAQKAFITLKPGRGVSIVDVIGCDGSSDGGVYRIPVGDVYANDVREFTVELRVPGGIGEITAVTGSLEYETSGSPTFEARVRYSTDVAVIEKHRDMSVQSKADVALSTRSVENAMKALDAGNEEEAKARLRSAREAILASPAASGYGASSDAVQEQAVRLESFSKSIDEHDAKKSKKEIQYENYRVQKKK